MEIVKSPAYNQSLGIRNPSGVRKSKTPFGVCNTQHRNLGFLSPNPKHMMLGIQYGTSLKSKQVAGGEFLPSTVSACDWGRWSHPSHQRSDSVPSPGPERAKSTTESDSTSARVSTSMPPPTVPSEEVERLEGHPGTTGRAQTEWKNQTSLRVRPRTRTEPGDPGRSDERSRSATFGNASDRSVRRDALCSVRSFLLLVVRSATFVASLLRVPENFT